ncbi:ATG8-interacting protein 1 isoform X2 [Macadamia integrifolia]|uniref:ATG8-interacting protein 1 isoform X2 n=1 Tax=Macadamia integrifolia TaxID=60698 RepID=UPI001C529114|nr:ATG8-interacting protein 1 isoform X2 [Macadamia integrifolia]
MADNKEGKETSTRGNEWEVVALTASTYAAAPGPERFESNDDRGQEFPEDDETSRAMFMSDHFVFPPSQHENLPLDADISEIDNETREMPIGSNSVPGLDMEEGDRSDKKNDENLDIRRLTVLEDLPGIQFFDEKGNRLSVHSTELEEGTGLQGLNLVDEEQSIYSASKSSSIHGEANISGSTEYDDHKVLGESSDPSQQILNSPSDLSRSTSHNKRDEYDGCGLPCEAWWKRRAASFYAHAKEANAFWSIFVAAALMGLVMIGQRWQQERWQVQQLKWQFNINDEMNRILGPISRLKDVIIGSHRQGSAIRGSTKH